MRAMVRKGSYGGSFDFTTDLVASWQFESNFNDYTGNHNANLFGTVTNNTSGKVGNQADFQGSTDYLRVADSGDFSFTDGVNDTPFSVSLWFNLDTYNAAEGVWFINKRVGTLEWQLIYFGSLKLNLFSQGAGANGLSIEFTTSLNLGQWYHLTITYDGSETKEGLKMYLDKTSVGTQIETGTYVKMINGTSDVYLGTRSFNVTNGELDGKLDEVKVYKNRELTQDEVTEMYNQENAGNSVL